MALKKIIKIKLIAAFSGTAISGLTLQFLGVFAIPLVALIFLLIVQVVISMTNTVYTRWVIKNVISPGGQLPMTQWFSWNFIGHLSSYQFLGILGIFSFSIVTFPLGIWIMSYSAGMFIPMQAIIGGIMGIVTVPLDLYLISKTVGEITFNRTTMIGLGILETCQIVGIFAWCLIYFGNR